MTEATDAQLLLTLRQHFGYDSFRGIQLDIIHSIVQGHDTLGLMPTGGGKSITFQVPALTLPGVCLVITPLIALMKDQVQHLRERGIKAALVHGDMKSDQILITLENAIFGAYKFLYISPERIQSPIFQAKVHRMPINLIVIDEAHCISQWGHDFRPSYLAIPELYQHLPQGSRPPILALTATATQQTITDIVSQLQLTSPHVLRQSFARPNLTYSVQHVSEKQPALLTLLSQHPGSCIIYTRSRQRTIDVARHLETLGHTATYYHAGLSDAERDQRQRQWTTNQKRIMVATNAFGMGIDKPDVRLVVHLDPPDSIEAYFQEAGRAGRDLQPSQAVMLVAPTDIFALQHRITHNYPPLDLIRDIYQSLCYYHQIAIGYGLGSTHQIDLLEFCRNFHYYSQSVESALRILTAAGYIEYRPDDDITTRVHITATRAELYRAIQNQAKENIINALLRTTQGIFSAPTPIDETLLCRETGLPFTIIQESLIQLQHAHILKYIPRMHISWVRYTTSRIDSRHLIFPPAVYQDRLDQYRLHIDSIIAYITNTSDCRNQQLLHYFGEVAQPCHTCDICQQEDSPRPTPQQFQAIRHTILSNIPPTGIHLHQLRDHLTIHPNQHHINYTLDHLITHGDIILHPDALITLPQ